jgi:hypothetical protein
MRRLFIIAIIAVAILLVGMGIYLSLQGIRGNLSGTATSTTGNLFPSSTASGIGSSPAASSGTSVTVNTSTGAFPSGSTFQIGTAQGTVTVKNFYKTALSITADNGTVTLAQNNDYAIGYYRPDSSFTIVFSSVPSGSFTSLRTQAEQEFLSMLGISEADACKLSVSESVVDKSSSYIGQALGLSFCYTY